MFKIHAHLDPGFFDRHDPEQTLLAARYAFEVDGDPELLLELFSTILRSQTQRAFGSRHSIEPNVHGVFELVMRHYNGNRTTLQCSNRIFST